ncbi:thiol-disulfide oxidoreductase DCC family protein [Hyphobacterium sp.]|jgi:predicted DCC family thiol-disulfide oxidoreductase YuxK|uniref:thiol-disulfide oxidoreductase DCC family protein n=1 Tax=Hyphobacterium sp. TaxID=2004662 RepID=UPI003BA9E9EC
MKTDPVIAYYDGQCTICVHEMNAYKRRGEGRIVLHDVNGDIPDDVDRKQALDALWLRKSDGELVTGLDAFIAIWERSRGLGWLAALTRPSFINRPLDKLYRLIAPYRPRRKCADGACEIES